MTRTLLLTLNTAFLLRVILVAVLVAGAYVLLVPSVTQAQAKPCGVYSVAYNVPTGSYGAAFNVHSLTREILLQSMCDTAGFSATIGSSATSPTNFAVYNTGYRWDGSKWVAYTLVPNGGSASGSYVMGNAKSSATLTYTGEHTYWVSFAGVLNDGKWKCGCRGAYCQSSFWNLQVAYNPPPPMVPGGGGGDTIVNGKLSAWKSNPRYWQLNDKPVLLLGGTDRDDLFQFSASELQSHINLLKAVGGNYVRNTMSDRKRSPSDEYRPGQDAVFAFKRLSSGQYDLNQWNDEYWSRFARMLKTTADNSIVVQIELWDTWDLFDRSDINLWGTHPWNPKNNVNYTTSNTKLPEAYKESCCSQQHPFFRTILRLNNDTVVLGYQRKFVEKMLSYSLAYDHVLYQIQNESWNDVRWSTYWANVIQKEAAKLGKKVNVTDSRFDGSVTPVKNALNLYSFADISQSSAKSGEAQMTQIRQAWEQLASIPINSTKQYGADGSSQGKGSTSEGIDRFMRSVFGGEAAVRFHRPESGLGLSTPAQNTIKSVRLMEKEMQFFTSVEPHSVAHIRALLGNRSDNEAYIMAHPGRAYAVYFPNGGSVTVNTSGLSGSMSLKWINVSNATWGSSSTVSGASQTLTAPSGKWIAVLTKAN